MGPRGNLLLLFCSMNIAIKCLLMTYFYPHTWVCHSALIRETSSCRWLLIQSSTIGQQLKLREFRVLSPIRDAFITPWLRDLCEGMEGSGVGSRKKDCKNQKWWMTFQETVFSIHSRAGAQKNSQRLWEHAEDVHKLKAEKFQRLEEKVLP